MAQFPVSTSNEHAIYAALELSKNSWLLAIQAPGRGNPSLHPIKGGDAEGLMAKLDAARDRVVKVTGRTPTITLLRWPQRGVCLLRRRAARHVCSDLRRSHRESCTTTPSCIRGINVKARYKTLTPAAWAMGSGSERASSRSFSPTICSRTGSAGRASGQRRRAPQPRHLQGGQSAGTGCHDRSRMALGPPSTR